MTLRPWQALLGAPVLLALHGCVTLSAPLYEPPYANVEALKAALPQPLDLGPFTGGPQKLSVRGSPLVSPVGAGFADYVRAALAAELRRGERLLPASEVRVNGTLLATTVDASGVSEGNATITVEFIVAKAGAERYRKTLDARTTWPSSFVGGVAIPRAVQAYPGVVAALFRKLYDDAEFVKAVTE